jgi:FKBP-type peptidyl-prolyl cis-trans isomerase
MKAISKLFIRSKELTLPRTKKKLSFLTLIGISTIFLGACSQNSATSATSGTVKDEGPNIEVPANSGAPNMQQPNTQASTTTTPSGLQIEDIVVGTGKSPENGQTVIVHYTGWLTNGQKFDSSVDRGEPFTFPLGAGHVIKGWDEGVASMKIGGKRKLTIPPHLGYGARGAGGVIPPNATLVFEVQLLGVQ